MIRTGLTTIAVITMAGMFAQSALTAPAEDLGKVHFETSCKPDAQQHFDQAMLYQHSFWYRASQKSFEDALKADPECAIAYWGIALSLLYNPHVAPPVKNLAEGAAALEKGKAVTAKTQRERDYIDALSAMYADYGKVDHRTRVLAYLKAMEQLAQRYPDDDEAQIYYALALNVAASPSDKTYANQRKGAAILEKIWARQPEHPGVAHYLIHLYDTPALAEKGLAAARRYAKVAPAAAHAQHMPSHIFTRLGYWQESIASNIESGRVAKEAGDFHDKLHSMSAATDAEDKTEKHPVTPGVPKPARELYGVMLLDSGNAREALTAFEGTLKKEPNRLGAYAGAAQSAEKAGDKA